VVEKKRWGSTARDKGTRTGETQAGKDRKGTRRKGYEQTRRKTGRGREEKL
jgi:hypothetical protein